MPCRKRINLLTTDQEVVDSSSPRCTILKPSLVNRLLPLHKPALGRLEARGTFVAVSLLFRAGSGRNTGSNPACSALFSDSALVTQASRQSRARSASFGLDETFREQGRLHPPTSSSTAVDMARRLRFIPEGGALVEVTCRTIHGRFLLKSSRRLNQIVLVFAD